MIKGIDIVLYERNKVGVDPFGHPVYEENEVIVSDVLVAPVSSEDAISELNLSGKHIVYQLAIPKGDTHEWGNALVSFFNKKYRVVGEEQGGIEENIPLRWNKKVKVELYEQA